METIEKLWEAVCSGDIDILKQYYKTAENIRYQKFGREHSLIMGAFRNSQWEVIDYLLSIGETITQEEKEEISTELNCVKYMEILAQLK